MSYQEIEASEEYAQPYELYRVTYGDTVITVTSGDTAILHNGEEYLPHTIKRTEVTQTQEMNKTTLTLTTSKNSAIAELFRTGAPQYPVSVSVFRQHSVQPGMDYILVYKGRITSCRFTRLEAELICEPIFTSLKRPGLRLKYEPACVNSLYDIGCKVNKAAFEVTGTVLGTDGRRQFTIPSAADQPDGYYVGGIMILNGMHMIADHVGDQITLLRHTTGEVGDVVKLLPGCNHTRETCATRFNNINNYRGFPWMTDRNPFQDHTIHYIE